MSKITTAKTITLKASEDNEYDFEGYLSTYGNTDRDGDIFVKGCFDESLSNSTTHPMLYGHDSKNPNSLIGRLDMSTDDKGLFVKGKFGPSESAENIKAMVKMGAINTMSVGCFIQEFEPINNERPYAGSKVTKADVVEGSIVPTPANPEALITTVKSLLLNEDDSGEVLNLFNDMIERGVAKAMQEHEDKIKDEKRQEITELLKGMS